MEIIQLTARGHVEVEGQPQEVAGPIWVNRDAIVSVEVNYVPQKHPITDQVGMVPDGAVVMVDFGVQGRVLAVAESPEHVVSLLVATGGHYDPAYGREMRRYEQNLLAGLRTAKEAERVGRKLIDKVRPDLLKDEDEPVVPDDETSKIFIFDEDLSRHLPGTCPSCGRQPTEDPDRDECLVPSFHSEAGK